MVPVRPGPGAHRGHRGNPVQPRNVAGAESRARSPEQPRATLHVTTAPPSSRDAANALLSHSGTIIRAPNVKFCRERRGNTKGADGTTSTRGVSGPSRAVVQRPEKATKPLGVARRQQFVVRHRRRASRDARCPCRNPGTRRRGPLPMRAQRRASCPWRVPWAQLPGCSEAVQRRGRAPHECDVGGERRSARSP